MVERIKALARRRFYDGLVFHRVIDGFMAQGGDPKGDGTGGSDLPDLPAEFNYLPHVRGAVARPRARKRRTAPTASSSSSSSRALTLDKKYTVFGRVIDGMDYVDAIERGEPPSNPTRIVHAYVAADNPPPYTPAPTVQTPAVAVTLPGTGPEVAAPKLAAPKPAPAPRPLPGRPRARSEASTSSTSTFRPIASRCARRSRAMRRGCWCSMERTRATCIVADLPGCLRRGRLPGVQRHPRDPGPARRPARRGPDRRDAPQARRAAPLAAFVRKAPSGCAIGDRIDFGRGVAADGRRPRATTAASLLDFAGDEPVELLLERAGRMPLPPYIAGKRPTDARDVARLSDDVRRRARRGRRADRRAPLHARADGGARGRWHRATRR